MTPLRIVIPLTLGLLAGGINFFVVRGAAKPQRLVVVRQDVTRNTELTRAMLDVLEVRADGGQLFRTVVPAGEEGALVGRRVGRDLAAGEAVLWADVRTDTSEDIPSLLKPGEATQTVTVPAARLAPGVRSGDQVVVQVASSEEGGGVRLLGPFRVVWVGERADPFRTSSAADIRRVLLAVPAAGSPARAELEAAVGGGGRSRVLGVEYQRGGATGG